MLVVVQPQPYLAQAQTLVAVQPQPYLAQTYLAARLPQQVAVAAKPQLPQQALVQLLQLVQPHWKWK